ncbi:hypothetical protein FB45DRAFT_914329 [Roridomyces roridus]|uniref:Uncharacterized protein n=1 Tax=Roridomyces roridus TaxID=1738132 RepID=A0AAD7FQD3_9AGAR|nr:hypothetical protein FB45DRAFT_914329 [Roridomyces roridus]
MALSAASAASTSAALSSAVAPASPFAQLLRNSRFATFDPQIRKTYYSPKQFVERGYWGLKRPITQRKRNSFITIKTWEARQHYVEWDNAEDQVRFIRRMEELDVRPTAEQSSAWSQVLGPARSNWLIDSEFSPHVWDAPPEQSDNAAVPKPEEDVPKTAENIPLKSLGNGGPGAYGHERRSSPSAVIPNVESMSPLEFKRYLAKMRSLRPAFQQYIARAQERQEQAKKEAELAGTAAPLEIPLAGLSLLQIARLPGAPHYRLFLAEQTEAEYRTTRKIQPQPHRNGALQYTHPSDMDTVLRMKPKPGIVLQRDNSTGRFDGQAAAGATVAHDPTPELGPQYIASFAGIAALIRRADSAGKEPLMDPAVDRDRWPNAVAELRPKGAKALNLRRVPRVVGPKAQGLDGVGVDLRVQAVSPSESMQRANPYTPGTRQYVAIESQEQMRSRAAPRAQSASARFASEGQTFSGSLSNPAKMQNGSFPFQRRPPPPSPDVYARFARENKEVNRMAIGNLAGLLGTTPPKSKSGEEEDKVRDDEL